MGYAVKYKQAIANILKCSPESIFLYWKGRVALYAVLKAMGVIEGDEIIIPAFTCVVVPNAIIYLGAKPVYVDISPENFNIDIKKLNSAISDKTRAIICQNTFGLSSNIEQILQIAQEHKLYTIEDCTHGFGGYYNGQPNGSYCDAAFYSTQWNKPFSTGIGGFSVINNHSLIEKVRNLEKEKTKPSIGDKLILKLLLVFRKYFVTDYTYKSLVKLFRFLSKKNLIIGSTQGDELSSTKMPDKYFKDISGIQIRAGLKQLKKIRQLNNIRKKNAADYTNYLRLNGKNFVDEKLFDNHLFLKYPLLVNDQDLFFKRAYKDKVVLGDWFISPLFPVKGKLDLWCYIEKSFPNSVNISNKIVNLPTDIKNNKKVLNFLSNNLDLVE